MFSTTAENERQSEGKSSDHPSYIVIIMVATLVLIFLVILAAQYWTKTGNFPEDPQRNSKSKAEKKSFIESSLPIMLQSSYYWQKALFSLTRYHPWLALLFPAPHSTPPLLRSISLFSKICMIYFLNSLVYDYGEKGYASCGSHGEESCETARSFLNVGSSMCYWDSSDDLMEGKCRNRNQNDNVMRLIFVSVIIGVIHTPVWLLLEQAVITRLVESSETSKLNPQFKIAAEDEELGFSLRNEFSSDQVLVSGPGAYFAELIRVVHHTAEKVADSDQRYSFMRAWKLFEENNPIFRRLRITQQVIQTQLPLLQSSRLTSSEKVRILIALFVGDFLPSTDYFVFWNQLQRHRFIEYPVTRSTRLCLWGVLVLSDTILLLYTVRFWWRHSYSTQFAFMISFFYWLLLEIFLFQGTFFIWNYLILPSRAMPSILAAQEFATGYLVEKLSRIPKDQPKIKFNAAHYLFASFQVAKLSIPDSSEKSVILSYHTVIPPEYIRNMTQFDRFIEYFATMNILVHDVLILTMWTLISGGFIILEIYLYRLNPFYVLFPFQALIILLVILLVFTAFKSVQISPETMTRYHVDIQEERAPPDPSPLHVKDKEERALPSDSSTLNAKGKEERTLPPDSSPVQVKDREERPLPSYSSPLHHPNGLSTSSRPRLQSEEENFDNPDVPASPLEKQSWPLPTVLFSSPPHNGTLPAISEIKLKGRGRMQHTPLIPSSPLPNIQSYNSIKNISSQFSEPFIEDKITSGAIGGPPTPEVTKCGARAVQGSIILADE